EHGDLDAGAVRGRRRALAADASGDDRGGRRDHGSDRRREVSQGVGGRREGSGDHWNGRIFGVKIDWRTVGAFQENSYLVVDPSTKRAVLIDPGAEADEVIAMVRASGATLEAIWLTHAHIDHIGAIAGVKRVWDVPLYMHPAD